MLTRLVWLNQKTVFLPVDRRWLMTGAMLIRPKGAVIFGFPIHSDPFGLSAQKRLVELCVIHSGSTYARREPFSLG